MIKTKEHRIIERILKVRKSKRPIIKAIKKAFPNKRLETAAKKKTVLMLNILNDEKLKAGEKLEKVNTILNKKLHERIKSQTKGPKRAA